MLRAKEFVLDNFIKSFLTLFIPFFLIISLIYIIKLSNLSSKVSIDFLDFLELYLYYLPLILFSTIPLTFIAATINTFAKLSQNNELIALFSLSYSPKKLFYYMLPSAVLISIFLLVLTILILPIADQKKDNFKNKKIYEAKLKIMPKKLSQSFGNYHIFIESSNNNNLKNVTMFNKEKNGFLQIMLAKEGKLNNKEGYLTLNNGTLYRYKDSNFNIMNFKNLKLYNNQSYYSSKILPIKKYWQKNLKNFYYYFLISVSPMFLLGTLIAFGVFNPRYQKNYSYFYILITALFVYLLAMLTKNNKSFTLFITTIFIWITASLILFKIKLLKRY
jgi:lipopolysaccharide export system permease protein